MLTLAVKRRMKILLVVTVLLAVLLCGCTAKPPRPYMNISTQEILRGTFTPGPKKGECVLQLRSGSMLAVTNVRWIDCSLPLVQRLDISLKVVKAQWRIK